jgi:pSer/pThr/pTyr-binding forkhead associated (FHA) protein
MRDGRTRRVHTKNDPTDFLTRNRASLTRIEGPSSGHEFPLDNHRILIGRSPSAGIQLAEPSVSHTHAALELGASGFGIRDLASTNGLRVNGGVVASTVLAHGDRVRIGACELQYVVEPRAAEPRWSLHET